MLTYNQLEKKLPTAAELPYSDDQPVDSELQDLVCHLLKSILSYIWRDRQDWFFGIDMAWHFDPKKPCLAPDGFLSLGVPRIKEENLRLSYVNWEENGVVPQLTIEVVSKKPGGEYKRKKIEYEKQGVLYYVIYAPFRRRQPQLMVYHLSAGEYKLIPGNRVWMSEIGLGIGVEIGSYEGIRREWLYWYDEKGDRYKTQEEALQLEELARREAQQQAQQAELARREAQQQAQQAELARREAQQQAQLAELAQREAQQQAQLAELAQIEANHRAEKLAAQLRSLGIEPDPS